MGIKRLILPITMTVCHRVWHISKVLSQRRRKRIWLRPVFCHCSLYLHTSKDSLNLLLWRLPSQGQSLSGDCQHNLILYQVSFGTDVALCIPRLTLSAKYVQPSMYFMSNNIFLISGPPARTASPAPRTPCYQASTLSPTSWSLTPAATSTRVTAQGLVMCCQATLSSLLVTH